MSKILGLPFFYALKLFFKLIKSKSTKLINFEKYHIFKKYIDLFNM